MSLGASDQHCFAMSALQSPARWLRQCADLDLTQLFNPRHRLRALLHHGIAYGPREAVRES